MKKTGCEGRGGKVEGREDKQEGATSVDMLCLWEDAARVVCNKK